MKHPVLRVKKGKRAYDDREDRLAEEIESAARRHRPQVHSERHRPGSFLRMRRGSLVPLFFAVLIAAIILRVLPKSSSRAEIDGWHVALQARVFGETLDVGVAFSRLGPAGPGFGGTGQRVSVVFVLPETGEEVQAQGTLSYPRVALRARMRYVSTERTLRATVQIEGQSRILFLPVPGP